MNGWTILALAFFLLGVACFEAIWQGHKHHLARIQHIKLTMRNAEVAAQNADLREALQETIAERDSLKLQLAEALKPKARMSRAKKVETK